MIGAFLDSWALFGTTYLAGWILAAWLGLAGLWVVARNQVFLGVAASQASALGVAAALWWGGAGLGATALLGEETRAAAFAVAAAMATALLARRNAGPGEESSEAVLGWVFLLAASAPVLLLAGSAHGLEEIRRLTFSTILGARPGDVWLLGALAAATGVLVAALHRPLLLLALDPETAVAVGMRRRLWSASVAVLLGLAVGLSIRISGLVYTFGCLLLPALVAKNLTREVRPLLALAPAIGLAAAGAGFVLAHHGDTPPAHTTVALLCAALPVAWSVRHLRRARERA